MTKLSASASSASDSIPAHPREGRLCLGEQDIHVWLCAREQISSSDEFKRRVLSRYAAVAPADWQFARGEQGKPHLAGTAAHTLDFNVSHSGDWLACAVTAQAPVGVDLEVCSPKRRVMTLARRFFREEEVAALVRCSATAQCDRFYDLWTLKESAVKARGGVLVSGLDSRGFALTFSGRLQSGGGRIALTTPEDVGTAQYCLLDPLPGYRLAICWLPVTRLLPQIQVFELCDADSSRALSLPLRASTWLE